MFKNLPLLVSITAVSGLTLLAASTAQAMDKSPETSAVSRSVKSGETASQWTRMTDRIDRLHIVSSITGRDYVALIQSPEGPAPESGWPSLWLMDGFATFPLVSDKRLANGKPPAGLIIAVGFPSEDEFDNERRSEAYTPVPDADPGGPRSGPVFGGSNNFRRFLQQELRPVIAQRYPLAANKDTLFGFSYGGLFVMDTVLKAPDSFARYWAASPSIWFSEAQLLRRLRTGTETVQTTSQSRTRLTITAGVSEQYPSAQTPPDRLAHLRKRAMIDNTAEMARHLKDAGMDVELIQAPGKNHMDMLRDGADVILDVAFGDDPFKETIEGYKPD